MENDQNKAAQGGSSSGDLFASLKVGDKVKIRVHSDNVALEAGDYEMEIEQADAKAVAVNVGGPWWFYRDNGHPYVGDAEIVEVLAND